MSAPVAGVYIMRDPVNGIVRYVGITNDVEQRMVSHFGHANNPLVRQWVDHLRMQGMVPHVDVAHKTSDRSAQLAIEAHLIRQHLDTIFNVSMGTGRGFRVGLFDIYPTPVSGNRFIEVNGERITVAKAMGSGLVNVHDLAQMDVNTAAIDTIEMKPSRGQSKTERAISRLFASKGAMTVYAAARAERVTPTAVYAALNTTRAHREAIDALKQARGGA